MENNGLALAFTMGLTIVSYGFFIFIIFYKRSKNEKQNFEVRGDY